MHLPNYQDERTRTNKVFNTYDFAFNESQKNLYDGKSYHLKTYGCQMNEHDSENIKAILEYLGFRSEEDYLKADVVILNTCSIRENAHNKAFGMLGRFKHLKEERKNLVIGLMGCMAQEPVVVNKIKEKYPFVNFVIGTHNLYELGEVLQKSMSDNTQQIEVYSREQDLVLALPYKRENQYKAFVNIIYGCDKFCTYCIVPYTRGKQRSRPYQDIINEVNSLVQNGYQEITLLGQNVNAYGKDLYDDYDLTNLLEAVAKTNVPRIRFLTSYPSDFTSEMVDVIAKYKNICPSIHLPVQSGSNRILKLMGRRYTKEEYLKLFFEMKEKIPHVTISTDIIVGFPKETEEDFQETLDLVKTCKFDNAYTFIYSVRKGTPAEKLLDTTSLKEKEDRLKRLNKEVNSYFLLSNKALIGKLVPVLVEGISSKENNVYGYSDTNKLVNFEGCKELIGTTVLVEITTAKTWSLDGRKK
ncbi:MAG: tRNA (N6-isopentenyl adenosine(37)-C2)-methylthiotransferase MiaB [Bacilli bacterium]